MAYYSTHSISQFLLNNEKQRVRFLLAHPVHFVHVNSRLRPDQPLSPTVPKTDSSRLPELLFIDRKSAFGPFYPHQTRLKPSQGGFPWDLGYENWYKKLASLRYRAVTVPFFSRFRFGFGRFLDKNRCIGFSQFQFFHTKNVYLTTHNVC